MDLTYLLKYLKLPAQEGGKVSEPNDNLRNKTDFKSSLGITINSQDGGLPGLPSIVGGHAGVVPRMTRSHGFDAQDTQALAVPGHNQTIVGVHSTAVLRPVDVHGQIALVYRTRGRNHVQLVDALLAKVKGHDLGQDWDGVGLTEDNQRKINQKILGTDLLKGWTITIDC